MPGIKLLSRIIITLPLMIVACSKKNDANNSSGTVSINNVSKERKVTAGIFSFTVSLDKAATSEVTMHYSTVEGSAKAGIDFTPSSGTITIPVNSTKATIDIPVTGDSLRKENQLFYIQLDNIQNAALKVSKGTGTIVNENNFYLPVDNAGYTSPATYAGYQLAWSDEFDSSGINTNTWNFEQGNNNGWGNNELENYTGRIQNAFASNGNLVIEARRENSTNSQYTSARMTTQGKKSFEFGRIDIRAKLPSGKGIWPALWMLGDNIGSTGWPACGEIDIMEVVGHEPNKLYGTLHFGSSPATHDSYGNSYLLPSGTFVQQFHVFSLLWEEDSIKILVDDQVFVSGTLATIFPVYPFNNNFFFIFNIAVGGNWPGAPDSGTLFPQRMFVDYVRVFKKI
jgi:beta-glucanase (GH16 family)